MKNGRFYRLFGLAVLITVALTACGVAIQHRASNSVLDGFSISLSS